jgi:hypothetical protein
MIVAVIGLTGKNYKELKKKCSVDELKAIAENE